MALAAIGAVISTYHVALEWIPALDTGACGLGPSCSVVWFRVFGFISLPTLALIAFLSILTLLAMVSRDADDREPGRRCGRRTESLMTKPTRAQRRAAARQPDAGELRLALAPAGRGRRAARRRGAGLGPRPGRCRARARAPRRRRPHRPVRRRRPPSTAGPPVITGTPLPAFTSATDDPAKGMAAPVVQGHDHQGAPVAIEPTGRVQMVIFAAHWCPHCQREIPLIQDWVDGGGLPDDVDIVTVSTGIEPTAPNYPPEAWFEREGWTAPGHRRRDRIRSRQAYGLASYPYFVILDGAGNVFARFVGEIPTDDLEQILATVPRT